MLLTYDDRWADPPCPAPLFGVMPLDEADLFLMVSRASVPNVPGLALTALGAAHWWWPHVRYAPLLDRSAAGTVPTPARLVAGVAQMDSRKRTLLSEDLGLGFAALHLSRLGVDEFVTKHELRDLQTLLPPLATKWGVSLAEVRAVSAGLSAGLKGADFIGYSRRLQAWVVWEAKGSAATSLPTRRLDAGLGQAQATAGEVTASVTGTPVLAFASMTHLRLAGMKPDTTVHTVDPPTDQSTADALMHMADPLQEAIARVHYRWVSSFLGTADLWGNTDIPDLQVSPRGLALERSFTLAVGGTSLGLSFTVGLDPNSLIAIQRGSLEALRDRTLASDAVSWLGGLVAFSSVGSAPR